MVEAPVLLAVLVLQELAVEPARPAPVVRVVPAVDWTAVDKEATEKLAPCCLGAVGIVLEALAAGGPVVRTAVVLVVGLVHQT